MRVSEMSGVAAVDQKSRKGNNNDEEFNSLGREA